MAGQKERGDSAHRSRWWVVHQHHQVDVVQADTRPDTKDVAGERRKRAHGPYLSREMAQARADRIYSRTTRARAEKAGVR